jgi:hypothetical protein
MREQIFLPRKPIPKETITMNQVNRINWDEGNPQAWNNLVAITIVSIWEARNKCKFENGSFDTQTILRLQAQKIKQSGIDMQHSTNTAIRLLGDRWIEHCPE